MVRISRAGQSAGVAATSSYVKTVRRNECEYRGKSQLSEHFPNFPNIFLTFLTIPNLLIKVNLFKKGFGVGLSGNQHDNTYAQGEIQIDAILLVLIYVM